MHWAQSSSSSSSSSSTARSDQLAGAEAPADVEEGPGGPGRVHEGCEVKVKGGKRGRRPKAPDPLRRSGLARQTAAASAAREPPPRAMRPRQADPAGCRSAMSLPAAGIGAAGGGAGATTSVVGRPPAVLAEGRATPAVTGATGSRGYSSPDTVEGPGSTGACAPRPPPWQLGVRDVQAAAAAAAAARGTRPPGHADGGGGSGGAA
jgi:hypothetical protein